jgi:hypothetical protein
MPIKVTLVKKWSIIRISVYGVYKTVPNLFSLLSSPKYRVLTSRSDDE